MGRVLPLLQSGIDRFVSVLAGVAALALVLMLFVTVGNIGLRLFATPYSGTFEIVGMLAVVVNGLALAEAQRHKAHIAIDLLTERMSTRVQLAIAAVVTAVSIGLFVLLSRQLLDYGLNLRRAGSVTESLKVPYWPLSLVLALGVLGLALALLSDLAQIGRNLRSDAPEGIW